MGKKSRKSAMKSGGRASPKLDTAGGEAAGILEFSFGYDFKKDVEVIDVANRKYPPPKDQEENAGGEGEGTAANLGQQGPPQPGPSSRFSKGMISSGQLALASNFEPAPNFGDGPLLLSDDEDEDDEPEDLTCPKCNKPSLIWVKNFLMFEQKWYGVLFQVCRDWKCAKFSGRIKKTDPPEHLANPEPEIYGPPIWTDEGLRLAEEREAQGKSLPLHNKEAIEDSKRCEDSSYKNNADGPAQAGPRLDDNDKDLENMKFDKEIQDLVDAALGDPNLGMPNPFEHPFDMEAIRAMTKISDSELLKTLKEVFPDGIPDLGRILGVG